MKAPEQFFCITVKNLSTTIGEKIHSGENYLLEIHEAAACITWPFHSTVY